MSLLALLAAIPLAGFLATLLARRRRSPGLAVVAASIVAVVLCAVSAFWFGRDLTLSGNDPIAGIILYLIDPAVGVTAVIAFMSRAQLLVAHGTTRATLLAVSWGIVLSIGCTAAGITAVILGAGSV